MLNRYYGSPPIAIRSHARALYAAKLFRQGKEVQEVAQRLNKRPGNVSRWFEKYYGMTSQEYIRLHKAKKKR